MHRGCAVLTIVIVFPRYGGRAVVTGQFHFSDDDQRLPVASGTMSFSHECADGVRHAD
jgi:hypothetical protein